jgi:hypothetical protein
MSARNWDRGMRWRRERLRRRVTRWRRAIRLLRRSGLVPGDLLNLLREAGC